MDVTVIFWKFDRVFTYNRMSRWGESQCVMELEWHSSFIIQWDLYEKIVRKIHHIDNCLVRFVIANFQVFIMLKMSTETIVNNNIKLNNWKIIPRRFQITHLVRHYYKYLCNFLWNLWNNYYDIGHFSNYNKSNLLLCFTKDTRNIY